MNPIRKKQYPFFHYHLFDISSPPPSSHRVKIFFFQFVSMSAPCSLSLFDWPPSSHSHKRTHTDTAHNLSRVAFAGLFKWKKKLNSNTLSASRSFSVLLPGGVYKVSMYVCHLTIYILTFHTSISHTHLFVKNLGKAMIFFLISPFFVYKTSLNWIFFIFQCK